MVGLACSAFTAITSLTKSAIDGCVHAVVSRIPAVKVPPPSVCIHIVIDGKEIQTIDDRALRRALLN